MGLSSSLFLANQLLLLLSQHMSLRCGSQRQPALGRLRQVGNVGSLEHLGPGPWGAPVFPHRCAEFAQSPHGLAWALQGQAGAAGSGPSTRLCWHGLSLAGAPAWLDQGGESQQKCASSQALWPEWGQGGGGTQSPKTDSARDVRPRTAAACQPLRGHSPIWLGQAPSPLFIYPE